MVQNLAVRGPNGAGEPGMPISLLRVENLRIDFQVGQGRYQSALKGIGFELEAHQSLALVGESGSGKSVTALAILGLLPASSTVIDPASRILWQGSELLRAPARTLRRLRGGEIGMIFQDPMMALNPVFTIGAQIVEALRLHRNLSPRAARERALELLDEVGLDRPRERFDAYPHQLSGGQQQRAMIAMAIGPEPQLLIADEPTTALDVTVQRQIMDLIAGLQQRHAMALLFITHDLALVSECASEVVVLRAGEIREQGPRTTLFATPRDPYTRALLACRPPLEGRPWRLTTVEEAMEPLLDPRQRLRGTPPDAPVLLRAEGLSKVYRTRTGWRSTRAVVAVASASFTLARGRTLGVVGESGSGKTTLGLMVAGILEPEAGTLGFELPAAGIPGSGLSASRAGALRAERRRIQIVFQNPFASLNPRFTIREILFEPMLLHGIGATRAEREDAALQWLTRVGLSGDVLGRYPHEFSGGQRQRIAIARCLTLRPEVLVCDESVSALDVSVQAQVLNLLQDLQDEFGMSYLFISHDLGVIHYMADEVLVMRSGEIVERGSSDALYQAPAHPYTRQLLAAIPRLRR